MMDIKDIVNETVIEAGEALRPLFERVYNVGIEDGKKQEAAKVRATLSAMLGSEFAQINDAEVGVAIQHSIGGGRAPPGTVKPRILELIRTMVGGITTKNVIRQTGLKPNSVRGTLWALQKEGLIHRADDKWVASDSEQNNLLSL